MEQHNSKAGLLVGLTLAVLVLAGLAVYALQTTQSDDAARSSQNQSETTTGSTETDNQAAPNPSERVAITFTNNGFEPESVTIKKGTVVTVTNNSSDDMQFSSDDHPSHQENTEMNLKVLSPGESESYTANEVGTWGFHDHIDDSKQGTVTVTE